MADSREVRGEFVMRRERLRRRATRLVLSLLVVGIVAAVVLLQGGPAQSSVVLGIFAACATVLYLIEVWARRGKIG